MKKYFLFLLTFGLLFIHNPIFSQVEHIHLSWNTGKKIATSKTMAITWTNRNSKDDKIFYSEDKRNLSKSVQPKKFYSTDLETYVYKAELKKLRPNTTYYYKCGSEEVGSGAVLSFKTGPSVGSQNKFVVGVWGDTQNNGENRQFEKTGEIIQEMIKHPLEFTIHMGDIVENGSEIESWKTFYKTTEPINTQVPFMPVTGNHDVCNDMEDPIFQQPFPVFHELFNLPRNNTDYSYSYGNTHFIALSSGHAKGVEEAGKDNWRYGKNSEEYTWLKKDLARARKDKNIKWIIVYMHHPLYSFGWSHVPGWQDRITPLLDKYKVDLALAGHRHVYERHKPIVKNKILSPQGKHEYLKPQGTIYITNGTAGGSPQGIGGKDMPSMMFTSSEKMYNYGIMTIEGEELNYEFFNEKGNRIDYFKIKK